MPTTVIKMDRNLRNSFKKAKRDIYALRSEREEQNDMILQALADHKKFMDTMEGFNEKYSELNQRITEVWEYAETVKARTTRLDTSMKKVQKVQGKLLKVSKENTTIFQKKVNSLNEKVAKNKSDLANLNKSQKTLSVSLRKTSLSRSKKFGSLNSDLEKVEGIGKDYANKLKQNNIKSTKSLLVQGATAVGRKNIAKAVKVNKKKVLEWVNRVDLMRVSGIGEEYSDLLEEAGVDSCTELAMRNPENLVEKMTQINNRRNLVKLVPSIKEVKDWIKQAKKLPKVVEH